MKNCSEFLNDLNKKIINKLNLPIFIQTPLKLDSTISFSQYIYKSQKLITIIGENHLQQFNCVKPSLSLADYCLKIVNRNPNCKIMLEFNKSVPIYNKKIQGIYSPAIQSIYSLFHDKSKLDCIIPFDERPFFLSPQGHKNLYRSNFSQVSYKDIEKKFVTPFGANDLTFALLFGVFSCMFFNA